MAANTRARAIAYGMNSPVSSTELQTIQVQAAEAVNRTNTSTGWRVVPVCTSGSVHDVNHFHGDTFDNIFDPGVDSPTVYLDIVGLPHGHQLDAVRVSLFPATGHGDMPVNTPDISVFRTRYSTGVTSTLGTAACPTAVLSTYEAGIVMSTSFSATTIDRENYRYWMLISGECDTNSVTGTRLGAVQAHMVIDDTEGGPDFSFW